MTSQPHAYASVSMAPDKTAGCSHQIEMVEAAGWAVPTICRSGLLALFRTIRRRDAVLRVSGNGLAGITPAARQVGFVSPHRPPRSARQGAAHQASAPIGFVLSAAFPVITLVTNSSYRLPYTNWLCFAHSALCRGATFCVSLHRIYRSRRYAGDARYCVSTEKGASWVCFTRSIPCIGPYGHTTNAVGGLHWLCFARRRGGRSCGLALFRTPDPS